MTCTLCNYSLEVLAEPGTSRLFHSPLAQHLPAIRAVQGDVTGVWKTVGIPTGHVNPWCNGALGNPNLYLDQPITKVRGHVSYPLTVLWPPGWDCVAVYRTSHTLCVDCYTVQTWWLWDCQWCMRQGHKWLHGIAGWSPFFLIHWSKYRLGLTQSQWIVDSCDPGLSQPEFCNRTFWPHVYERHIKITLIYTEIVLKFGNVQDF